MQAAALYFWGSVNKQWGPLGKVSKDLELLKVAFKSAMAHFGITFEPWQAGRHSKLGSVEWKDTVIRTIWQKLKIDERGAHRDDANLQENITVNELQSRDTYLSNVLYGSKVLSSFKMVRGYTRSIMGLPKTPISAGILKAHLEQEARRKLRKLDKSRNARVLSQKGLPVDTEVYYIKNPAKFGTWHKLLHSIQTGIKFSYPHKRTKTT